MMKIIDQKELDRIYQESVITHSDQGSCVLGYSLKLYGKKIVPNHFKEDLVVIMFIKMSPNIY